MGLVKTLRLLLVHIQDGLGVRVQKPRTLEWVILRVTTCGHSNAHAHTSRLTAMLCPLLSSSVASPPSMTSTLSALVWSGLGVRVQGPISGSPVAPASFTPYTGHTHPNLTLCINSCCHTCPRSVQLSAVLCYSNTLTNQIESSIFSHIQLPVKSIHSCLLHDIIMMS